MKSKDGESMEKLVEILLLMLEKETDAGHGTNTAGTVYAGAGRDCGNFGAERMG